MAHDVNLSVSPLPLADISWATSRLTLRGGKRTAGKWPETRLSPQALASLPAWPRDPYWVFRKDQSCNKIIVLPPQISITLTILPTQPCHSCDSKCSPWLFLYEYCVPGREEKEEMEGRELRKFWVKWALEVTQSRQLCYRTALLWGRGRPEGQMPQPQASIPTFLQDAWQITRRFNPPLTRHICWHIERNPLTCVLQLIQSRIAPIGCCLH